MTRTPNIFKKLAPLVGAAAIISSCEKKPESPIMQTPVYLRKDFTVVIRQKDNPQLPDLHIECGLGAYRKEYRNFKGLNFTTPIDADLYARVKKGEKLYAIDDGHGKYIIRSAMPGSNAEKELIRIQLAQERGDNLAAR